MDHRGGLWSAGSNPGTPGYAKGCILIDLRLFLFTVPQFLSRGRRRNDLLNPAHRGTMQAVKGTKTLPVPVGERHRQGLGSVSDHRTHHTPLWTTRKQHGQRGPKMKWSGAETAKNGRKCPKKVPGAGSHCRGRRFESDQVHQKERHAVSVSFFLGSAGRWPAPPFGDFNARGRQSRPCAKVFACGENACKAQKRRRPEGRFFFLRHLHLFYPHRTKEKDICKADVLLLAVTGGWDRRR